MNHKQGKTETRDWTDQETELVKIGGMQCSFCVESIRKAFTKMKGVVDISVNLSHEEALIQYQQERVTKDELHELFRELGYTVRDPRKIEDVEAKQKEMNEHKRKLSYAAGLSIVSLAIMTAKWMGFQSVALPYTMLILTLVMVFGVGRDIMSMAIASVKKGILNQHVLMEFGAVGGLIGGITGFFVRPWPMSDFFGAAILITAYHILSAHVSLIVRIKSSQAIVKLMELQPNTARVEDGDRVQVVPLEKVKIGDHVRVRPGERIPVDGKVIEGSSAVDMSLVTGEPLPAQVETGDSVIGGSLNQFGSLLIEVSKVGENSFLQQVSRSIQEARALKPGILQIAERILQYFVPGVILAAGSAFLGWTIIPWILTGEPNFLKAIFSTLAVLVMGYPCALGMATPLAMIRGGGIAAEKGILMRSGEAFQVFKDVSVIALDKTGSITEGKPRVVGLTPAHIKQNSEEISERDTEQISEQDSEQIQEQNSELITIAAAVEHSSEHPLAQAITKYASEKEYRYLDYQVEDFKSVSGLGVEAQVNGAQILVGSPRFLSLQGIEYSEYQQKINEMETQGTTVVGVARNKKLLGLISIADTLKADAEESIQTIQAMGMKTILITGDNKRVAEKIAKQLNISEVYSEVTPQEKAELVRKVQRGGERIAMVGDGINDAPALMQADVGIAFNSGSDIAIESADIILVNSTLRAVIDSYVISKKSYQKTKQNVLLAFVFNGIGIPLAMLGLLSPVFAMLAMATSVTTVLLNSFGAKLTPSRKVNSKSLVTMTYKIPTIHCNGCVELLKMTLDEIDGVKSVSGEPVEKTLSVQFENGKTSSKEIVRSIQNENHKVETQTVVSE